MAKRQFFLEVENKEMICGGFLCSTPEMTVKQVLKYAERFGRDFFNNNPTLRGRVAYDVWVCADEDCYELLYFVSVWGWERSRKCTVCVYDIALERFTRWD